MEMYDGEGDVEILDPGVLKKQPLGGRGLDIANG